MNVIVTGEPLTTDKADCWLTKSQVFPWVTVAVPMVMGVELVVETVKEAVCVDPPLTALTETGDGLAVNTPFVVPPPPPPLPGVLLFTTVTVAVDDGFEAVNVNGSPLQIPDRVQSPVFTI
jgi:hypothetical protein